MSQKIVQYLNEAHVTETALIRESRRERSQRMEVSLGRTDGSRAQIERSHESFDPLRDPAMRPTPSRSG